jgi:hypothetical protein
LPNKFLKALSIVFIYAENLPLVSLFAYTQAKMASCDVIEPVGGDENPLLLQFGTNPIQALNCHKQDHLL